jgi:hypothetical protein
VTLIVGYNAGGGTDTIAGLIAESLSKKWNQQSFVVNTPGAAGAIGVRAQIGYVWGTKVLGGVPMIGLSWGAGNNGTSAKVLATLPSANPQGTSSDSVNGGTDLYLIATLSWSRDNDN